MSSAIVNPRRRRLSVTVPSMSIGGDRDELASHVLAPLVEIEDRMFAVLQLDVWERVVYYYLLRHTHAVRVKAVIVALSRMSLSTGMSESKARETIRSLDKKGCVRIHERGKDGHSIEVLLPGDIPAVAAAKAVPAPIDIERIDFYTERKYLAAILRRESGGCFYCGRILSTANAALDHVVAQANGGTNSHRNIVAVCHDCNSTKQSEAAPDFLRGLYRAGVLSQLDLTARLQRLELLGAGQLDISLDEHIDTAP